MKIFQDDLQFIIRSVTLSDLDALYSLSLDSDLLNVPSNKDQLYENIIKSEISFAQKIPLKDRQFTFVIEDQKSCTVVGTSTIYANYVNEDRPLFSFKVFDSDNPPPDTEIAKGCQLLRLKSQNFGLTALGGLLVASLYRGLPEKLGKQISHIRFVLMGMLPEEFNETILVELMAPIDPDGKNLFWEAIGKKFTNLEYEEVFKAARAKDRSFIPKYFPERDLTLSADQKSLHRNIYSVSNTSKSPQHMLTELGFKYLNQVDPMDGGLHYGAQYHDIEYIQNGSYFVCGQEGERVTRKQLALVGLIRDGKFCGAQTPVSIQGDQVFLPLSVIASLHIVPGESVFVCRL